MSSILTGDSGTIVFERIGTITGEDVTISNKATSNPIEKGSPINDHAVNDATKFNLAGVAVGAGMRATLENMAKNRDLLSYRGKESYDNLLILNLNISHATDNINGFTFTASMQRMQITAAAFAPIGAPTMSSEDKSATTKARTKAKTEQGLQTPATTYGSHVSQYDAPAVNKSITQARTNPSDKGY